MLVTLLLESQDLCPVEAVSLAGSIAYRLPCCVRDMIALRVLELVHALVPRPGSPGRMAGWALCNICAVGGQEVHLVVKHPIWRTSLTVLQANDHPSIT